MNADIQIIEQMLKTNSFDLSVMKDILSHYQDNPAIVPCKIFTGAKILRSSTNDQKQFHDNVSRLSYPPAEFARTDRASLKGKPMFYGTVFTSAVEQNGYPRIFSLFETADLLRDFQRVGKLFTTQSLWLPDRDLHLFSFPFSKKYETPCDEVSSQRLVWDEHLSKHWPEHYVEFSEYMGDLISKENYSCLYDITATAIDYILNNSSASEDLDGVMYPSVWSKGKAMNICLKKEVVDECVHFQAASVQYIDKTKGSSTMFGVANSYLRPDGHLDWTPTAGTLQKLQKVYGVEAMFDRNIIVWGKK